jgi:hypothetical protein
VLTVDPAVHQTLWALVAADAPLDEILEGLSGHGLRNLPSFALARMEGAGTVRVVVRGRVVARFDTETGEVVVGSASATTWVEQLIESVEELSLSVVDRDPDEVAALYHVLAGTVPADVVIRSLSLADQHALLAEESGIELSPTGLVDPPVGTERVTPEDLAADDLEPEGVEPEDLEPEDLEPEDLEPEDLEPEDVKVPTVLPPPMQADPAGNSSRFDSDKTLLPSDIDELHWTEDDLHAATDSIDEPQEPTPPIAPTDEDSYDFIYGRTVARSVQRAAVQAEVDISENADDDSRISSPSSSPSLIDGIPTSRPVSQPPELGDHDGRTMSRADIARLRAESSGSVGPTVQAALCVVGHPNPTHLTVCRTCGGPISSGPPSMVARPPLGVLRFSNGVVVALDRPQLIGRNPRVEGSIGGEIPNLIKLGEAGQGVSRRHIAIHLEGWQVLLEDLASANGTVVALPGRPARRLNPGEPMLLEPGAVVDLGGEMTMSYEANP